ncbi:MAG: hypothetical protein A3C85_00830 [Candidatus Doudnabacteria bacterium RIFCSPHIGHO2_02_FULL_48_21]|uniref:Phage shock protein PspC N-terminal domain-containing protein n=1 Tax=Candidatus Doudnabacteria bacterium RIFCSPLOWO2_02_FULL_48_13 TaxID=1817845 RepID=A0A1F5QBA3_9BACT|nr:MAG: hypothetical protein A3K05_01765 [Candidatus Doudnabacteria bacterium RIFCSPHIGHO2_01_48_18]OGE77308.1 MAG: hypothetical protein A2668_02675 [Candidatus Doudnabacteria bacterium RIFCSPHIGHO2_01_FULL_48_180]OGE91012.1 MAG: hypothetical protein A3F44_01660 [Candidatus Doudnabacteria bacterium RIFCSPHIGHO2_12_FULL_47_25]OGE92846.1 MAG: hypothetical protein A3C85_00830 [Candidatus Doudnabacteria bacterium RIFCSPHIGHO2_02_FULL_48_21]OGE96879.1 MAG: hypothetical protein A3A83_04070 [Candidatu
MEKRLYRSRKNKVLSGILGGIGEYYAADPLGYRILFYFLAYLSSTFQNTPQLAAGMNGSI